MSMLAYSWALPLLPLAAFVVIIATGRKLPRMAAPGLGIAAMGAVFAASLAYLFAMMGGAEPFSASVPWLQVGDAVIELGVQVDPLTSVMLVVVSLVSLLVQIYSIGYMSDDDRFRWYFGAISLFTAAMLGVVLANGWLLMYMCWEVMGLSSYLLIGFWFEEPIAAKAASKAFLVTRIGDVGFGLALVVMWTQAQSFQFEEVFHLVETGSWFGPTLVAAALLLFLGAMGKSAQFPLHVWLPDAMAGPTPGSALIHAATMVAAGVYLVARSFPLFEANPETLQVVLVIGTITAVLAAMIAVAMNDIKKVLAYSTISQLGYMMIALGLGSWVAAIFHLMTHAFFKALLFLGAGSVIHATHTQDLHEMGGLAKKMPWTAATWVLGALSLAGIPPLAGFWSKDEILLVAYHEHRYVFLVIAIAHRRAHRVLHGARHVPRVLREAGTALQERARARGAVGHARPARRARDAGGGRRTRRLATDRLRLRQVHGRARRGRHEPHARRHRGQRGTRGDRLRVGDVHQGLDRAGLVHEEPVRRDRARAALPHRRGLRPGPRQAGHGDVWSSSAGSTRRSSTGRCARSVSSGSPPAALLSVFDRKGVDGAVDGLGDGVVSTGGQIRRMLTGNVQTYLLLFVASILVLVAVFAR